MGALRRCIYQTFQQQPVDIDGVSIGMTTIAEASSASVSQAMKGQSVFHIVKRSTL